MHLLGHSAGTNLAVLYAVAHPERLDRLLLITPSLAAVGIDVSASDRRQVAQFRKREAWFPGVVRPEQSGRWSSYDR